MTNESDVIAELIQSRDECNDLEMELVRLVSCYEHATPDDKRVIWAVLNKYAPLVEC